MANRRCSTKITLAAIALVSVALSPPVLADRDCRQTSGYVLCLDSHWLRYYTRPPGEVNWQDYAEEAGEGDRAEVYDRLDRTYQEVLGRRATSTELQQRWQEMEEGKTLVDIRRELATSDELRRILNRVYRDVLGRDIDENGWQTWSQDLAEGATLASVVRDIATSEEAQQQQP